MEVSLRTFVNKGRTATLAVRCLPRSTSRAEALNEFSKTGETLTKIAEDLYSVERKAGLLGITSYLRIGDEAHVVSLVSEADGAERSRLRAAIIQVLSRP